MLRQNRGMCNIEDIGRRQWNHPNLNVPGQRLPAVDPGMNPFCLLKLNP
jgi:hypothetical protein